MGAHIRFVITAASGEESVENNLIVGLKPTANATGNNKEELAQIEEPNRQASVESVDSVEAAAITRSSTGGGDGNVYMARVYRRDGTRWVHDDGLHSGFVEASTANKRAKLLITECKQKEAAIGSNARRRAASARKRKLKE